MGTKCPSLSKSIACNLPDHFDAVKCQWTHHLRANIICMHCVSAAAQVTVLNDRNETSHSQSVEINVNLKLCSEKTARCLLLQILPWKLPVALGLSATMQQVIIKSGNVMNFQMKVTANSNFRKLQPFRAHCSQENRATFSIKLMLN